MRRLAACRSSVASYRMSDSPQHQVGRRRTSQQFERELAAAKSARDAQSVRDRYLGRKNSVVAAWMQSIGERARRPEEEHRPLRERAETGDRSALAGYDEAARDAARRAGGRRRHAARPRAAARPSPSADHRPRPARRDLHAHGLHRRRRSGGRRRLALLRRAEHAGRTSRARHAGHAVSRDADPGRVGGDRRRRTLLRTHTSSMQIRYMQAHQPPIRSSCPAASIAATISI